MPTYTLGCDCGTTEIWRSIHDATPWGPCETCGVDRMQVIGVPKVVSLGTRRINHNESALSQDRDAYKRLRNSGLQPKQVNGSALLEKSAETQFEVEYGRLFPTKEEQRKVKEGMNIARDIREGLA